jgi:hypothetical protein
VSASRRLVGLVVGLALALGAVFALVAAPGAPDSPSPPVAARPQGTGLPTPDPSAMFDLMVSESEYCQCNK